jgi:hypothetical protein
MRITPNPQSMILANAVVGGAGLVSPPEITAPAGMGIVILYVPLDHVVGKTQWKYSVLLGCRGSLKVARQYGLMNYEREVEHEYHKRF